MSEGVERQDEPEGQRQSELPKDEGVSDRVKENGSAGGGNKRKPWIAERGRGETGDRAEGAEGDDHPSNRGRPER
jgi:hypothetical protein